MKTEYNRYSVYWSFDGTASKIYRIYAQFPPLAAEALRKLIPESDKLGTIITVSNGLEDFEYVIAGRIDFYPGDVLENEPPSETVKLFLDER